MAFRILKIETLVKRAVGEKLRQLLPREYISITEVQVSPDIKHAVIWVSALNLGGVNQKHILGALAEQRPRLQEALAGQMQSKFTPKLEFKIDQGAAHAAKIDRLLQKKKQS